MVFVPRRLASSEASVLQKSAGAIVLQPPPRPAQSKHSSRIVAKTKSVCGAKTRPKFRNSPSLVRKNSSALAAPLSSSFYPSPRSPQRKRTNKSCPMTGSVGVHYPSEARVRFSTATARPSRYDFSAAAAAATAWRPSNASTLGARSARMVCTKSRISSR